MGKDVHFTVNLSYNNRVSKRRRGKMGKKQILSIAIAAALIFGLYSPAQANSVKVYWDGLLMVQGQIGKIKVIKPINLWKREGGKLVFSRILKPGEHYRVYRYDNLYGGQYGLGGGYYITNMQGYVDYRTPSKKKLAELEAAYGKLKPPPTTKLSIGKVVEEESKDLAPGLTQTELSVSSNSGPQKIYTVEYDGKTDGISIETGLAKGQLFGFETVESQAKNSGEDVIAGVNGDYFDSNGHPIDLMIHKGDIISTSKTPLNELAVFGVTIDGKPIIGNPSVNMTVHVNGSNPYKIDSVNRTRSANHLVLYNPYFSSSTRTNQLGTEVIISVESGQLNGHSVLTGTVKRVITGVGNEKLNDGEFILSGHHLASNYLQTMKPGDRIEVRTAFSLPEWNQVTEALSGRYHLVKNGQVVKQTVAGVHPRSAIGIKSDGSVIAVVADGRKSNYSVGLSLQELATVMKDLGAVQAFTFDGGGSSTLVSKDPDSNQLTVQNQPSDGRARAVANALFFVKKSKSAANSSVNKEPAPSGTIQLIGFEEGLANFRASGAKYVDVSIKEEQEIVRNGKRSAKLAYDFTGQEGTSGVYLEAISPIKIDGLPKKIGMWVYGDGKGHWLRMQLRDSKGQVIQLDFTKQLMWTGWKYIEVELPNNLAAPLWIEAPVRYMEVDNANKNKGAIYVDDIQAIFE